MSPPGRRPATSSSIRLPDAEPAAAAPPVLSVVVPTRNEAANIEALWRRLSTALGSLAFEVCFVDDSDDETATLLVQLEEADPHRVRCRLRSGSERRGGLSTAVIDGLHLARGSYVCVMDADLQHPPESIPPMLAAAQTGADLVVASRHVRGGSSSGLDGISRRLVSGGARLMAQLLFSEARRSSDPLSGFFLCRRELIDGIEFRPVGFKILLELLVCVPHLEVRDVPLRFEQRAGGQSKASLKQGILFLRHVKSLFLDVDGSARLWKFGLVGLSGLAIFLPLLALFAGGLHLNSYVAFWPAYIPSLAWNTGLNRRWTFADQRGGLAPREPSGHVRRALLSGAVMYCCFAALISLNFAPLIAGALAAVGAMGINGLANRRAVHRRVILWSRVSVNRDVQSALARLASELGAERAYVLPPHSASVPASIPASLLARVVEHRRATSWTEASSHRAQRRTNIDLFSTLLIPVVSDDRVLGVVVCERTAPSGYAIKALETATRAVETLIPSLIAAAAGAPGSVPPLESSQVDPSSPSA